MSKFSTEFTVTTTGPFFTKGSAPVVDAVRDTIAELAKLGEGHAKGLAGRHSKSGRYRDAIKGKVAKTGKSGRIKAYGGPKKMGYSAVHERGRYWPSTGHRFAGHHVLKATGDAIERNTQSVLQKHIDRATAELNA